MESPFRKYLELLEAHGELERVTDPIPWPAVASRIDRSNKALLFTIDGFDFPVIAGAMAKRSRWALALGVPQNKVSEELERRLRQRIAPVSVTEAPVQEVVVTGDDIDLSRLPAHLQHPLDGAPFISSGVDVTRRPDGSGYNLGVRRLMMRGPKTTGINISLGSDLGGVFRKARSDGKVPYLEIAMVIGLPPTDYLATQLTDVVANEYELLGALRESPVPVVKARTVDLEVPADAEMVIEGRVYLQELDVEGPFGDYTGTYETAKKFPMLHVTAITHRKDAIFQSVTIGGTRSGNTDQANIASLRTELAVSRQVLGAIRMPVTVYCPPAAQGRAHARISLPARGVGLGRDALVAALASFAALKQAVVFDDDVDIFDDDDVEWAISTRVQADRDVFVLSGMRASFGADPSLPMHPGLEPNAGLPPQGGWPVTSSKMGIDATCRYDKDREHFERSTAFDGSDLFAQPVDRTVEEVAALLEATLDDAPYFADWIRRFPELTLSEYVHALEHLRQSRRIALHSDGRYRRSPSAGD